MEVNIINQLHQEKNSKNNQMMDSPDYQKKIHSLEFKKFFLLEFTKQLIKNSSPMEVLKLKSILEEKAPETKKEIIKEIIKDKEKELKILSKEKPKIKPLIKRKSFPFEDFKDKRLIIPETRLPQRLDYIKPLPIKKEIDLGKLNPLIQDPFVKTIECYGDNMHIVVRGNMGVKKTNIILDNTEIDEIIKKISDATKIPASQGIYKVAIGRLIFFAIISEIIGSKFIIKKMMYSSQTQNPNRQMQK